MTQVHRAITLPPRIAPLPLRIGHGYDLHRLQAGGKLMLGGVEVSQEFSPIAHSDGDVVIHALVDAMLGAMGLGDIGLWFPNTDPAWADAPSKVFLEDVRQVMEHYEYRLLNVDITVLAERPKLKDHRQNIVESIAGLLRCEVGFKAGTNEQCDAIGQGQAIAAHAVVLMQADF